MKKLEVKLGDIWQWMAVRTVAEHAVSFIHN